MSVYSKAIYAEYPSSDDGTFSPRPESRFARSPSPSGNSGLAGLDKEDDTFSDAALEYKSPVRSISRPTHHYSRSQGNHIPEVHHSRSRHSTSENRRSRSHLPPPSDNRHSRSRVLIPSDRSRSHISIHSDRSRSHISIPSDDTNSNEDELIRLRKEVARLHTECEQLKNLTSLVYVI